MFKTSDDLPKLFRSLGSNDVDLRSVNSIASRDAEQRWPLLKAMPPKEPPLAPLLTAKEKQSWQTQGLDEPARYDPAPARPSLGDKLASSLKKIAEQAKTEQDPRKSRSKPVTAASVPEQELPSTQVFHLGATVVQASTPKEAGQTAKQKKKAVETGYEADAIAGPIWGKKERSVGAVAAPKPSADDSLNSVFGRLEPVKKEAKPPLTEKRPSYLGRLGRK